MASFPNVLRRIRAARREEAPPQTQHYDEYEPAYEAILEELEALAGNAAIDRLRDWMVAEIHETGHLPEPDDVRERAREICAENDVEIPDGSGLAE